LERTAGSKTRKRLKNQKFVCNGEKSLRTGKTKKNETLKKINERFSKKTGRGTKRRKRKKKTENRYEGTKGGGKQSV